jgi:hypothetical protein
MRDSHSNGDGEPNDGILSPEDLELEETQKLDENRHVVPVDDEVTAEGDELRRTGHDTEGNDTVNPEKAYSITATVRTPDEKESFETASNDVTEFFEEFLRWYLGRIAPEEEPEEALEVLTGSSF